ncbi:MAG: 3-hydroxyacyl-CoA dehydrogenase family protein [Thermomicrobiales bacterium]
MAVIPTTESIAGEERRAHGVGSVMVVGAGTMGRGIAQVCAEAGYPTLLFDADAANLERGFGAIDAAWVKLADKGKKSPNDIAAYRDRLAVAASVDAAAGVDLVIEAIYEHLDAKLALYRGIDAVIAPSAILASNTSSISITRLAAGTTDPARFVGLHFFNPVPILPLVEVVRGLRTADSTADRAAAFARSLGKTPVTVNDAPGFVANRILLPMINEAVFTLAEGVASKESIDEVMKLGMAHPIGPLALADLIGLDVCLDILQTLHRDFGDSKYRPAPLLVRMVASGALGRKTGEGFYRYDR